ncbi:MAG: DUF4105 domain-containing protein [Gammaproteobacteria bacterium]|nr:DUF4105 domain-containing protein [Gammaproteobacteria bacterium]
MAYLLLFGDTNAEARGRNLVETTPSDPYLHSLIQLSRQQKLYTDLVWHALLHYKPGWWHDHVSEVDGEDFFLSQQGKTSPQAELEATLASFFSKVRLEPNNMAARCRFQARYFWLKQKLRFDEKRMPHQSCPEFNNFFRELNANGISLIFPSSDPNNPSAMLGHTLLRMDKKGQTPKTRMLAHSVNYAAEVEDAGGLSFMWNGVVGGFKGRFRTIPYHLKLREYHKIKNRDVWEYQLLLNQAQVDFIIRHVFEIEPGYFDYYFFTENCSYHVLSLLDTINPQSRFTDQLKPWVTPVDTIKLLKERGIIGQLDWYPSPQTKLKYKIKRMSSSERDMVVWLAKNGLPASREQMVGFSSLQQARIFDLGLDYLKYQRIADNELDVSNLTESEREILLARSKLKHRIDQNIPIPDTTPEEGHDTSRLSLGVGERDDTGFMQLGWRGAYHDFLDPTPGYVLHNQIEIMSLNMRYTEQEEKLELDELVILDTVSLAPRDDFFKDSSWRLHIGIRNEAGTSGVRQGVFELETGAGLAYSLGQSVNMLIYGFADVATRHGKRYDKGYLNQYGLSAGALTELGGLWKLHFYMSQLVDISGNTADIRQVGLAQSFILGRNVNLRLEVSRTELLEGKSVEENVVDEAFLSLNIYH